MTFDDVTLALEKGTVIFNAAGAHIPKLAASSLACTDATSTPNAMNIYVTTSGKRTSAPPHTDKQDVVIVQTCGSKHWKVYAPPNSSLKPTADIFARGKGDDNLPLFTLEEGGRLLLETTLHMGDVLFIPAAFPHTTSTSTAAIDTTTTTTTLVDADDDDDATSIHLTFNIDTHIWGLDYLSARRLALRRARVQDTALGQVREEDNRYVGKANELPLEIRQELFAELPLGFLDDDAATASAEEEGGASSVSVEDVTAELMRISKRVDPETFVLVNESVWRETVERVRQQGMELFEIHRDMYLAAIEEGRLREAEDAMTAHLDKDKSSTGSRRTMTPERMQRLSLFRVQRYYEKITESKAALVKWSFEGKPTASSTVKTILLPEDWAFTMPIKVGDKVEADLGGAFFPATVTRVIIAAGSNTAYEVEFFDGDKESGLERGLLKLTTPPNEHLTEEEVVDTSSMTPKQLKRWKKQQEKK
jgi:hypothetical protein